MHPSQSPAQDQEFPDSSTTHTMTMQSLLLQGQLRTDLRMKASLFFWSSPTHCSKYAASLLPAPVSVFSSGMWLWTVKLGLGRALLLRSASQSSILLVHPASPIWEELQVWRDKLQLLLLKWQTNLYAIECHTHPSMSLCASTY